MMSSHLALPGEGHLEQAMHMVRQTGVLLFMNRTPTHWHSKTQATTEASTFGAEF